MEIIFIVALVLLNGVFAMSELALVSSRRFKLEAAKKKGSSGAKTALELSDNPSKFLSTVQIGITLIGILLGVYSGENLTTEVTDFFLRIDILSPYAKSLAVGIIVLGITYLSIVLGELFPKRLGMTFPEPIAILLAKPMKLLSQITSPFVWVLTHSNEFLLTIFGIKKSTESKVSEEEIKAIIKESAEGGEIQDIEQDIVERVFELGDRNVNSLFTHSSDIVYFDTTETWDQIKAKINEEKHSAYPVVRNNDLDDILGIVLLKDLFYPTSHETFDITQYLKKPVYINENTSAFKVLEMFKMEKFHYGIVIDEYGTTIGIVTMDDVLDALIGDATELDQDEYQIVQRDVNSWLVDGQYSVIPFLKYFDLSLEEYNNGRYTTVAGLVMHVSTRLPDIGDKVVIGDLELEVVDKDGQRIDKIMVTKITE
jgi:putative hemolysin